MTDDDQPLIREAEDDVTKRPTENPEEKRREEAFHAGYSWRGVTFKGLTPSRKMLCDALCYKAGLPPLNAGFDDLQWFAPMSKAIVFVCSTDSKTLKRMWALGIDTVFDSFKDWVDANVRLTEDDSIMALGQQILVDSRKNQAEAMPSAGAPGK